MSKKPAVVGCGARMNSPSIAGTPAPVRARIGLATTFDRGAKLAPEDLVEAASRMLQRAGITDSRAALVLDAHLSDERLCALVPVLQRRRELPVLAIEAQGGLPGRPALASLDKEESRLAVGEAEATLRRAAELGAPGVVLRLGWVEGARRDWSFARERFLRGALTADLGRGLIAARDRVAFGHLDRARAGLDRLCRLADSLGVSLRLKNGQRYVELPSPRELDQLRQELRGAPLQGLFDLPAAHLPDRMGLVPLAVTEVTFGGGTLAYLGDACAAVSALPPGHGELGAAQVQARMAGVADVVFRPWPLLTEREITAGLHAFA